MPKASIHSDDYTDWVVVCNDREVTSFLAGYRFLDNAESLCSAGSCQRHVDASPPRYEGTSPPSLGNIDVSHLSTRELATICSSLESELLVQKELSNHQR